MPAQRFSGKKEDGRLASPTPPVRKKKKGEKHPNPKGNQTRRVSLTEKGKRFMPCVKGRLPPDPGKGRKNLSHLHHRGRKKKRQRRKGSGREREGGIVNQRRVVVHDGSGERGRFSFHTLLEERKRKRGKKEAPSGSTRKERTKRAPYLSFCEKEGEDWRSLSTGRKRETSTYAEGRGEKSFFPQKKHTFHLREGEGFTPSRGALWEKGSRGQRKRSLRPPVAEGEKGSPHLKGGKKNREKEIPSSGGRFYLS